MTTFSRGEPSSSSSRRPAAAESTTLLCSGSKASVTPWASATASDEPTLSSMSRQASGVALSGCLRHKSSASREPVHNVTTRVPSAAAAAINTPIRRRPSARTAGSGWAMLYVPETAAIVSPRRSVCSRMPAASVAGIASGSDAPPASARLNCIVSRPLATSASSVAGRSRPAKVFAKIPMSITRLRPVRPSRRW